MQMDGWEKSYEKINKDNVSGLFYIWRNISDGYYGSC